MLAPDLQEESGCIRSWIQSATLTTMQPDDKLGTVPILPISLGMKASTFINFAKASDCSGDASSSKSSRKESIMKFEIK